MGSVLPPLSAAARKQFFEDLNYLNLGEFRGFCRQHGIPYKILAETTDGRRRVTSDTDRKPIVLERIRHYLKTGKVGEPTCLRAAIVRAGPPPRRPEPSDRIYYRHYNKTYEGVMRRLAELTDGRFKDGAVARVLIMDFWTKGKAPTMQQFARAWVRAKKSEHELVTPEYAYLTDLARDEAGGDWKAVRKAKAKRALKILDLVTPPTAS